MPTGNTLTCAKHANRIAEALRQAGEELDIMTREIESKDDVETGHIQRQLKAMDHILIRSEAVFRDLRSAMDREL